MDTTRLLTAADAPVLAGLLAANREFLAPWQPIRPDAYYTVDGQRDAIEGALAQYRDATVLPHAILDADGRIVGRVTLAGVVRGFFCSGNLSYWLAEAATGRGLATAAIRRMVSLAFTELDLHRVQAETLPHNTASQAVLTRAGFTRFGEAPGYLKIAGRWQDHVLYQLLRPEQSQPPAD